MATQPIYAWKDADTFIQRWNVTRRHPDLTRGLRFVRNDRGPEQTLRKEPP